MGLDKKNVARWRHIDGAVTEYSRAVHQGSLQLDTESPRWEADQEEGLLDAAQVSAAAYLAELVSLAGSTWVQSLPAGSVEALRAADLEIAWR